MRVYANSWLEMIVVYVYANGDAAGSNEYLIVFDSGLYLREELRPFFFSAFLGVDDLNIWVIA